MFSIGAVERDTGIGRDTLRIWERRYGFPLPQRNAKGERVYAEDQVKTLLIIKQLLDNGMRPGKVVGKSATELETIARQHQPDESASNERYDTLKPFIDCVINKDAKHLGLLLESSLVSQGLNDFVIKTASPLLAIIGEMWASGKLRIFEEHFVTRQLTQFLDAAMSKIPVSENKKPVLLATLPNEPHTLSLLMIETLLRNQGQPTINLGPGVPLEQLSLAFERYQPMAIFLSFSGAYNSNNLRSSIIDLAERLPDEVPIWVGGAGVKRMRKLPRQISIKCSLEDVLDFEQSL